MHLFWKKAMRKKNGIIKATAAHCTQVTFEETKGTFLTASVLQPWIWQAAVYAPKGHYTPLQPHGSCRAPRREQWGVAWDMRDPWCAWHLWARTLHALRKLDLFRAPNHCGVERNNLWVRSNSRTMSNSNSWIWQNSTLQMLMNSSSLKDRAIILIMATARVWLKSGIFCSLSTNGCGHPSQPPQWLQKPFGPAWPSSIVGSLCQICLLCEQALPFFNPQKARLRKFKQKV